MPTEEKQTTTSIKKPHKLARNIKLIFGLIGAIIIIIGILWSIRAYNVYISADKYKSSYDLVQKELTYCNSVNTQAQEKKIFDYCDELTTRFKTVQQ